MVQQFYRVRGYYCVSLEKNKKEIKSWMSILKPFAPIYFSKEENARNSFYFTAVI